jgi:S-DNA-T family DNA segregation ATPase FtsK/SpoIIIE
LRQQAVLAPAIATAQPDDSVWVSRPGQRPLAEIRTVGGPGAGRVWALGMGIHDIGPAPGSTIEITGNGVPELGVQVKINPSGQAWLRLPRDGADPSAVRVNVISQGKDTAIPRPENGEIPWPIGGDLVFGEVLLRITAPSVADAAIVKSGTDAGYDYIRAPRTTLPVPGGRFRLPPPPAGRPRAIRGEVQAYRERRAAAIARIRQVVAEERKLRCDTLMDPATAALTAIGPGRRLWERRRGDADHLVLRVGTVNQPSMIDIEDPARDDAHRIGRWLLLDVPFAVDLAARGVLGLFGPNATATRAIAAWMVIQAAVLHSPSELRICLLTDGSAPTAWDWVGRLPHTRHDQAVLVGGDSVDDCIGELVSVIRARGRGGAGAAGSVVLGEPDMVVVVDSARQLGQVDGIARILADGPAARVFAICLDEQEGFLPRECTGVVRCDLAAAMVSQQGLPDVTGIRPDLVTRAWCERVADSLAELRDVPMAGRG